jgi:hypothetical protein
MGYRIQGFTILNAVKRVVLSIQSNSSISATCNSAKAQAGEQYDTQKMSEPHNQYFINFNHRSKHITPRTKLEYI